MNEWDYALQTIRQHGRYIAIGMIVGCICATIIIIIQKPVWQATMIVGPTEKTGIPSLSSFLPNSAADAPALQYFVERIDASKSSDFTIFETMITSPTIIKKTMSDHNIKLPYKNENDLRKYFSKNLKIRSHGLTPFKKITLQHHDVQIAIQILYALYKHTDQEIRKHKKSKTNRRISYLTEQLKIIRNPQHREAIISLLKEQEQISMMISIDNEFSAQIIEPPHSSIKPIFPNWKILFPCLIFTGGIIGFMFSGFKKSLQK